MAQRPVTRTVLAALAIGALGLVASACTDDGGTNADDRDDTVASDDAADLLGPEEPASGEPVRIGMVSDGATAAYDNTDELRAAEATADYYNDHHAGVGGRPIELMTCETRGEASVAVDCANRFISDGVVAVAVAQSAVLEPLWETLHEAGVPTFILAASGDRLEQDDESTFIVYNPLSSLALPIAVAEATDSDRIAFAVIDVPQAVEVLEGDGDTMLSAAGLAYDTVRIPIGTADMTSQAQQVAGTGAGVTEVVGNDAFCIAAFQGLEAVGYDGAITVVSQCITDATREAMAGRLAGISVLSNFAIGATDDPTFQLYLAVMDAYGDQVSDIDNATSVGGYGTSSALFAALVDISAEVTPETVIEAIKTMEKADVPAGGGVTFQCGGSVAREFPSVCTNQWLRTELDADGDQTTYTVEDSSDLFS